MDIFPEKAQYLTGEAVYLRIDSDGRQPDGIDIWVYHLSTAIMHIRPDGLKENAVKLGSFEKDLAGYGVKAVLSFGNEQIMLETAFDVVSSPGKSLRYGFVSDFESSDMDNGAMDHMRKLHINMVQYYDWSYRHDCLVAKADEYTDMMGKKIDGRVVKAKIEEGHRYGIKSIGYGAIYAASREFYEKHREWGLYNSCQEPFVFIDTFYLMNISGKSPWRRHIRQEYLKALEEMGFDGIHMDTYGFPKTAYSHLEKQAELIHMDREFPTFIDEVRECMKKESKDAYLIFNNVGNWPVYSTADTGQDAVYIEVWEPYSQYYHIAQLIREAQIFSKHEKPVILAAYMKAFRNKEDHNKAFTALKLLTAAIVSKGAYHLVLGEKNAVLTQGYYSDYSILDHEEIKTVRRYYDFMIRYMNLFYDSTLTDVSMTHTGWDNYEYRCPNQIMSSVGEHNKIWWTIRENDTIKTISLINLVGCEDSYWAVSKNNPEKVEEIRFEIQVDHTPTGIYSASPDGKSNGCEKLPFIITTSNRGRFACFTLPVLYVWSIIWLEFE